MAKSELATSARLLPSADGVAKRREHGDKLSFVDLLDYSGIVQCVIDNAVDVRSEYVVKITGVVRPRPEGTVNVNLSTGEVEIGECLVDVLRSAEPPPFPVDARADDVDENVRLQYRYIDIRRERMQKNLRTRAKVTLQFAQRWNLRVSLKLKPPCLCLQRQKAPVNF